MSIDTKVPEKKKKGIIPNWFRSSAFWQFLSNVKLARKRMNKITSYRIEKNFLREFRYFMAVEYPALGRDLLNAFQFNGVKYYLRPMEWHLMDAILLEQEYGAVAKLFETHSPSVIIDAGANVGMFSVYALSKWPTANVLAVEPGPETFRLLERNQQQNPSLNWRLFPFAFWKEDGVISFETTGLSMAAHVSDQAQGVSVAAIRFDHFIDKYLEKNQRISILKMDIEGAEEFALLASRQAISRVDCIIIEIHPGLCDESSVRKLLGEEFPFVYELSTPSTEYPVVLATRMPVSELSRVD